jgi:hypothetical protein
MNQAPRRLLYFLMGVLPALVLVLGVELPKQTVQLLTTDGGQFPHSTENLGFLVHYIAAQLGLLGLCVSTAMSIPIKTVWLQCTTVVLVVLGVLAMAPFTFTAAVITVRSWREWAPSDLLGYWYFLGPVVIGAHFLYRTFRARASNNRWRGP